MAVSKYPLFYVLTSNEIFSRRLATFLPSLSGLHQLHWGVLELALAKNSSIPPSFLFSVPITPNCVRQILPLTLMGLLTACQPPDPLVRPSPNPDSSPQSQLTLKNATLEQTNAQGQLLWKIQVQDAKYTPDRKNARLAQIRGDLYQEGKIVLKVKAERGEIQDNGQKIILTQNIVALDPRNQAVLYSQEVTWEPQSGLLIAQKNFRGEHPELVVRARQGRYQTQQQHLQLRGQIEAIADQKKVKINTEELIWEIPSHILRGERPLQLVRYADGEITAQVDSPQAQLNLKSKQVFLPQPNQFKSLQPPLQINAKNLTWFYGEEARRVETPQPLKIFDYQEKITVLGNQGKVNFKEKRAWLQGGTQALSERNQAQLFADEMVWNIQERTLAALGNIVYQQQQGVKFNLTGDRALGSLTDNTVVVTSQKNERVVTEIYPSPAP